MLIDKNGNFCSVVTSANGFNDPEAISGDGILINKSYHLIYKNELAPEKFASYDAKGIEIQKGLMFFEHLIKETGLPFHEVKSGFLMPFVEGWGRKIVGLPFPDDWPSDIRKVINKALKNNKKCLGIVNDHINAYLSIHVRSVNVATRTLVISDELFKGEFSEKSFTHAAEWVQKEMNSEQFSANLQKYGVFKLSYPDEDKLKTYRLQ